LRETGIKEFDWSGRYWVRWSDAIREAGFAPNKLQAAYERDDLICHLALMYLRSSVASLCSKDCSQ
jgi:hypothetical protein